MAKPLIIVESPTKIKTLQKLLGDSFTYESSVGHIRDLPEKGMGIDIAHDFEPQYEVLPSKAEVVERLCKAAKRASLVYLCPDPDREGEAIAWHIASLLPEGVPLTRATFSSLTKSEVQRALEETRPINMALVNAQQARRILDRLVGYTISPLLVRRIARGRDGGLSAGRVQSVALKLVVDREKEIEAFKPVEYWTLAVLLSTAGNASFEANLITVDGLKIEKEPREDRKVALISNEETAMRLKQRLEQSQYTITSIERKEKRRHPVAPFTTSTLQQEASRHHGMSAQRTMSVAQSLYEGVALGNAGQEGLITYMRTDSVRTAPEAIQAARSWVKGAYGDQYLPESARHYSSKRSAQDAHEAVRPTNINLTPDKVKAHLTKDQFNLYTLIWKRFVSSQMASAIYDTVSVDIDTDKGLGLRSTGSQLKFAGFLKLYQERGDDGDELEDQERLLPDLTEGSKPALKEVSCEQSFTKPPPRYSEASLVKQLEQSGIGRPSTYAAIMNKIQSRDYTEKEKGTLKPTELGRLIAMMLEDNFGLIMQVGFTAEMENKLEEVSEDKAAWQEVLKLFWSEFEPLLEQAKQDMHVPKLDTGQSCPECSQGTLLKIWAKGKYFLGCSRYPDCSYTTTPEQEAFDRSKYAEDFNWEQACPKCGQAMTLRHGRYGPFLGCSAYPDCRGIVNIPKKGESGQSPTAPCPAIGCSGTITMRRARTGRAFFSCSEYPECDVIVNSLDQLAEKYPNHPKTAYVAKSKKGAAKKKGAKKSTTKTGAKKSTTTRAGKAFLPTEKLAIVVGPEPGTRPEMTKRLWAYIKQHKLQDPQDGRRILPNTALAEALNLPGPVGMMELQKWLSPQLKEQ